MLNQTTDLFGNTDDDAIYQENISVPLDKKIPTSIAWAKEYEPLALSMDSRGYALMMSFGKDSIAVEKILILASVKYFKVYSNTTIDPPELIYYAKQYHKDTVWLNPEMHLISYMAKHGKGLPTRIGRWCCEVYKEQAFKNCFRVLGVRSEESKRRKGLWRILTIHSVDKTPILNPILYWTDNDVWDFIHDENIPYCSLYDEPEITRLGCIGCPMAGCKQMAFEFERWPNYKKLWFNGTVKMFDNWRGVLGKRGNPRAFLKFESPENLFNWWITEGAEDSRDQPDCQMWMW